MKNNIFTLSLLALICSGCATYSTYSAGYSYTTPLPAAQQRVLYSPQGPTSVYAYDRDMSLYLDLQAVAAAFAQSYDIKQFESLLNDDSYMISNLDMNGDGYVDYLRVIESFYGNVHLFVIQAVLGMNVYQDVATVVVENPGLLSYHIEIVGDPYLYGPDYYICPDYYTRPRILGAFTRSYYSPWVSPWIWDSYPSHYHRRAPRHLHVYRNHITVYMANHRYCHHVSYPDHCHYANYHSIYEPMRRNDYGNQHPDGSFTVRNANTPAYNSAVDRADDARRAANARDIEQLTSGVRRAEASAVTTGTSSAGSSAARSSSSSSSSRSSASSASSASSTRSSGSSSSGSSARSSSSSRSGSTTSSSSSSSRSNSSASTGSSTRSSSNSSSARSSSSGSSSRSSGSTASSSSTRSSSSSSARSSSNSSSSRSSSSSSSTRSSSSSSRSGSSSSSTRSSSSSSSSRSGASTSSSRSSAGSNSGRR